TTTTRYVNDTMMENDTVLLLTEQRFAALHRDYTHEPDLNARLIAAVTRNLSFYGFGMKGFALSMIETALDVTNHRVPGTAIAEILAAGRELLNYPIETLPYVDQALEQLRQTHRLILVTKGDVFDQERKLAASGLAEYFAAIEIVTDKNAATYARIFERHTDGARHTVMVGNSLRSDVLPALAAGGYAVYVPHDLTWSYEHAEAPVDEPRYASIAHLGELADALAQFEAADPA